MIKEPLNEILVTFIDLPQRALFEHINVLDRLPIAGSTEEQLEMKTYVLGLFLSITFNSCVVAQIDTERIPPRQDFSDLFKRAEASRFVVVGTVSKSEGVSKRLTPELLKTVNAQSDLSLALGGTLYTISVEDTVCRQTDFKANDSSPEAPQTVYVFLPRDEPMSVAGHWREVLVPGQRYLLFLASTTALRQKWIEEFQLDPKRNYFRAEEHSRGVVPLAADHNANQGTVLGRLTRICQALRPATVKGKLAALKNLATSDDPMIREEAYAAESALRVPK